MLSEEKIFKKVEWRPFNKQQEVLDCRNKEVIISAGRGFGKSMMAGYILFRELADAMVRLKSGDFNGFKAFVVAPTYTLTEKVFEHFISSFLLKYNRDLGKFVSGGGNRPYQFKISNDIWIQSKTTTESVGLLGERTDLLIADEAARIPDKVYYQYLRPLILSKERKGLAYYISTPRGRNWFQNKFISLKEKNAAFQFKSLDGVNYTPEMIEEEKGQYPEMLFRQEFLAEFVSDAGTVFKKVDDVISDTLRDPQVGHYYTMGVDLGEAQNWTGINIIDTDTKEVVYVDKFKRPYPLQKRTIKTLAERYNNARIVIDASGVGRPIYEDLREDGLFVEDFTFTGKSKEELIGKLIVFMENKYIRIPNYEYLIDELKAFEYKYINEKTGEPLKNIKYGAPSGLHDDLVDSLALAVYPLNPGQPRQENKLKQRLKQKQIKPQHYI